MRHSRYGAVKMFVGLLPVKEDLKRIRAVRDAIGGGQVRYLLESPCVQDLT